MNDVGKRFYLKKRDEMGTVREGKLCVVKIVSEVLFGQN